MCKCRFWIHASTEIAWRKTVFQPHKNKVGGGVVRCRWGLLLTVQVSHAGLCQVMSNPCQTITKRALTVTNYLFIVQYSVELKSPAFGAWWGCWWNANKTCCSELHEPDRKLRFGRNDVWHHFLPLCGLHCIFWWKVEIEFREQMWIMWA